MGNRRYANVLRKQRKWSTIPEPRHINFYKGDNARVLTGPYKGAEGVVLDVLSKRHALTIKGINLRKRLTRASLDRKGFISQVEAPILWKHVRVIDPSNQQPTTMFRTMLDGKSVRASTTTGAVIPVPDEAKAPRLPANPLTDTPLSIAHKVTYKPPTNVPQPQPFHTIFGRPEFVRNIRLVMHAKQQLPRLRAQV